MAGIGQLPQSSGFPQNGDHPSNSKALVRYNGALGADYGLTFIQKFRNTVQANASYQAGTAGSTIRLGNSIYMRNSTLDGWILLNPIITSTPDLSTRLISGSATWSGSGLVFNVTACEYLIVGQHDVSPDTTITLSAADPSLDRIDVIYLDTNGIVGHLTGTPSATPLKPVVNPASQLELTHIDIRAGQSTPVVKQEVIYKENVEWAGSMLGVTANFNYATNPYQGVKSTLVSGLTGDFNQYVYYTRSSPIPLDSFAYLRFYIRNNSTPDGFLTITIGNQSTATFANLINVVNGTYNYDSTIVGAYQLISIPLSDFVFPYTTDVDFLMIQIAGATTSFQLDNITFVSGNSPSSSGVTHFNGRTGAVMPQFSDYTDFYIDTTYLNNTNDSIIFHRGSLTWAIKRDGTSGGAVWGAITGTVSAQTDLLTYLSSNYVPSSRTLTINGTSFDLSANRSWTIPIPDTTNQFVKAVTQPNDSLLRVFKGGSMFDYKFYPVNSNPKGYLTSVGSLAAVTAVGHATDSSITVQGVTLSNGGDGNSTQLGAGYSAGGARNTSVGFRINTQGFNDNVILGADGTADDNAEFALSPYVDKFYTPGIATGAGYVLTDLLGDDHLTMQPVSAGIPYSGATGDVDLNNRNLVNVANIGVGTSTPDPTYLLDVEGGEYIGGNLKTTGDINFSSLKTSNPPPAQSGTIQNVTTDINGHLGFSQTAFVTGIDLSAGGYTCTNIGFFQILTGDVTNTFTLPDATLYVAKSIQVLMLSGIASPIVAVGGNVYDHGIIPLTTITQDEYNFYSDGTDWYRF